MSTANRASDAFNDWIGTDEGNRCLRFFEEGSELRHQLKLSFALAFSAGANFGIDASRDAALMAIDKSLIGKLRNEGDTNLQS